jgi:ribosomal protein L7/L12
MSAYPDYLREDTLGDILRAAMERRGLHPIASTPQHTQEQEPNTMDNITTPAPTNVVTFDLHYVGNSKIPLIKILRSATGCDLITAKNTIEASLVYGGVDGVRMTEAQYGRFIAFILADTFVGLDDVRMTNVRVAAPAPRPADFTALGTPTFGT